MTLQQYLQNNFSYKSIKAYTNRIALYKKYNYNHTNATLKEILQYIQLLRKQNKHPKTIKNHLHSIKIYYDYLQHTAIRKDHPCKKLYLKDKIDKQIKIAELYSQTDLQNYLAQTPKHKKLMVSLLVYQALTTSELVFLKVKQFNLKTAELILHNRTLPLKAKQIVFIQQHIQGKKNNDYVFITRYGNPYATSEINHCINVSRNKTQKITPLKIRQSVIKNLLLKNDIRIVQTFAGHRTSNTTEQYKSCNLEELKQELQHKHPIQ